MEKSADIVIIETRKNLVKLLETCGLPLAVIQMMINEIKSAIDLQVFQHLQEYENKHNEEKKDGI